MARHLLIGNNVAATGANKEVDKAVNIQKLSADGPVELGAGDGIADSDSIRFVQGTASGKPNVYSPWIKGRNIISAGGKTGVAQVGQITELDITNNDTTTGGDLELKFVRLDGPSPEMFNFTVNIPTGKTYAEAVDLIQAAYALAAPDWLAATAPDGDAGEVQFHGQIKGGVCASGNVWEYGPTTFKLILVGVGTIAGPTISLTGGTPDATVVFGSGDGNEIADLEKNLQGVGFGFYDRRNLPKNPDSYAVAATVYDVYSIVASKDGSTTSAINGVDNLIEINIALSNAGTGQPKFESQLNGYIGSAGFAPINL
tara:strand:+ start:15104 stop:16045 length:942 start_codon:yes stop_codon:yes gene_type:complete